jgi:hypothetical protein
MDVIRKLVKEQNSILLTIMAEDFFPKMKDEKEDFMNKYHKENFSYMKTVSKDVKSFNEKRMKKILK